MLCLDLLKIHSSDSRFTTDSQEAAVVQRYHPSREGLEDLSERQKVPLEDLHFDTVLVEVRLVRPLCVCESLLLSVFYFLLQNRANFDDRGTFRVLVDGCSKDLYVLRKQRRGTTRMDRGAQGNRLLTQLSHRLLIFFFNAGRYLYVHCDGLVRKAEQ